MYTGCVHAAGLNLGISALLLHACVLQAPEGGMVPSIMLLNFLFHQKSVVKKACCIYASMLPCNHLDKLQKLVPIVLPLLDQTMGLQPAFVGDHSPICNETQGTRYAVPQACSTGRKGQSAALIIRPAITAHHTM